MVRSHVDLATNQEPAYAGGRNPDTSDEDSDDDRPYVVPGHGVVLLDGAFGAPRTEVCEHCVSLS